MATKKIESDDDFLGGQGTLTAEEEKALSDFFRKRKMASPPILKELNKPKEQKLKFKVCPMISAQDWRYQ